MKSRLSPFCRISLSVCVSVCLSLSPSECMVSLVGFHFIFLSPHRLTAFASHRVAKYALEMSSPKNSLCPGSKTRASRQTLAGSSWGQTSALDPLCYSQGSSQLSRGAGTVVWVLNRPPLLLQLSWYVAHSARAGKVTSVRGILPQGRATN